MELCLLSQGAGDLVAEDVAPGPAAVGTVSPPGP